MMSLTFGLFTQVSGSGPLGPLVYKIALAELIISYLGVFNNVNAHQMLTGIQYTGTMFKIVFNIVQYVY